MDMSPIAIDETPNHLANAFVILLCFYAIVAWMLTHRFRVSGGELSRASVAFALAPQFLGLAATWRQLAQALMFRPIGGGIGSTAALFAEALSLPTLSLIVGAIVAFCFLMQSRRGGWHRAVAPWFDLSLIVLLIVWLIGTVALARSVASLRFPVAVAWMLAAFALVVAIGVFVVGLRSVRTSRERVNARPAFAIPVGVIVFGVVAAFAIYHVCEELARIAITGRLQ